ncbi:sugar O-acyltransferase (sialic acid O-acetyltransferase NeuD family) [Tenacibaculum adriaticum]|uniref:Sugar O-acyltransferase (Sialic acid O-acetyltransferase NeuD family) n=1 Tax=Tenacibaculum adriaticum TaxID=413713 RepID=A0A5S5DNV4_9FLAO|nr:acetyltransferase [Tenacibaculum adriaticum]TYP97354.1 sugar O-acyltransferase (sialic acid O-acetyltransferase NeuD family) [Tenacibaculum adriaticum]
MKKIAIIGAGGLGREILGIIECINSINKVWDFIGFYDDNASSKSVNGHSVIGNIDSLNFTKENVHVIIGIGNPSIKEKIKEKITNPKIIFPNLIHPSAVIYSFENVKLGKEGVVIGANCVLTVNISIGNYVYLNTSSVISHDTIIGDYSMIMPTVSISTGAKIGKRVYLGNGVKIDSPIEIEDDTIIKAGSILSSP